MACSCKTPGERDFKSESREPGEPSESGGAPELRMATVLATSSQTVVKKRAIYKRRLRETPPLAALLAKQQSRAAPEVEVGILQGGSGCS